MRLPEFLPEFELSKHWRFWAAFGFIHYEFFAAGRAVEQRTTRLSGIRAVALRFVFRGTNQS
jgi:hypothetical protein